MVYYRDQNVQRIVAADERLEVVEHVYRPQNAERIVLCVNFLASIPTELLEQMKHTTLQKYLKAEIEMIDFHDSESYVENIFSPETIALAGGIDNLDVALEGQ